MSEAALDRLYAAFAEFMTPDEAGEPLLLAGDLKHALGEAGISPQLAPQLLKLMDPESVGSITFEQFSTVCGDVIGAQTEADREEEQDEAEDDDSSDAGGFDPEDFDDEEYVEEDRDDEEEEQQDEDTSTRDHIFDVVSSNGRITVATLRREAEKLKFTVPTSDLEQMVAMASNKEEFAQLWRRLQ